MRKTFSVESLLDKLPGLAYRCRLDSRWATEYVSAGVKEVTGYPPEAFAEHGELHFSDLIHPEDKDSAFQEIGRCTKAGKPFTVTYRIIDISGQVKWLWDQGQAIYDEKGQPAAIEGFATDITSQKQAEKALQQSNQRLSLILQSSNEGIYGMGPGLTCTFINRIGAAMLGYHPEELIGRHIHDMAHYRRPDGSPYPAEECPIIKAATGGASTKLETEVFWRRDGTSFPVSYSVAPKIIDGKPCGAVVVFSDITERKRAEQREQQAAAEAHAAAKTNALLRTLFEYGSYFAGVAALDGTLIEANRLFLEASGYTREQVIGKKFWECAWWNRSQESMNLIRQGCADAATGKVFHQELAYFTSDGDQRIVDTTLAPVKNQDGEVIYIAPFGVDITEIKRTQEALQITELTHQLAAEAANIGTWEQDLISGSVKINPISARILGLPEDQRHLMPDEYQGSIYPEDRHALLLPQEWAIGTGKPFNLEFRQYRRNSELIWISARGIVQKDKEGRPVRAIGVMMDITEQQRSEDNLRAGKERFQLLTEFSPDAILVDLNHTFVYANPAAAQLFGAEDINAIVGRNILDFLDVDSQAIVNSRRQLILEEKQKPALTELKMRRLDGALIDVQAVCGKVIWEGQAALQVMLRDVTELKRTQDKLRRISERLQLAIEGTGEGIWDWDMSSNTFTLSGGIDKILGRTADETQGTAIEWRKVVHPDDMPRVIATFQKSLKENAPVHECEYRLKAMDGSWKWIKKRGVVVERDKDGRPLVMTGTLVDITARKESDELAWRHANLDSLTDLPNRRLFRSRLELELIRAKRNNFQVALLFIDLDGFKQVNDLYGHDAGDTLLIEVAHRLKNCVRETDAVARLGGDEFTIILADLEELDNVQTVCQKILASLCEPFQIGNDVAYLSASIGISLFPLDAVNFDEMIRKADQAMYAAKQSGKNQFHYFTREMDEKAHLRLRLINELRFALKKNQLTVHYQPVVNLKDGQIFKAEALLRWHHPKLGDINPSEFIPLAEDSGLIKQIGNWVFKQAALCCKHCSDHMRMPFQIGVNKSPLQFMSRDTDSDWLHFLAEIGLAGESISVEITEGVLLHASSMVEDKLLEYRDAGIQVALDDFGTGYSSMSYLQKFHIDYVKIDQSFVADINVNPHSRTIAESIIAMAHKLGLQVIAEGIETEEQLQCLLQAGCDYGQGFLFAPALPEVQLIEMLSGARNLVLTPHV